MTDRRVLLPGTRRVPSAIAPDLRGRSYCIVVELASPLDDSTGVLLACGDGLGGFAVHVDGHGLHHTYQHAGRSSVVSGRPSPAATTLAVSVTRHPSAGAAVELHDDGRCDDQRRIGHGRIDLLADARLSHGGLDVGVDRGVGVGDYAPRFPFTGSIRRVVVTSWPAADVDHAGALAIEFATG